MNSNSFSMLCDDFFLDMNVNTVLELPKGRDTVLTFFERINKKYPSMGSFYRRENNEYCLEETKNVSQYRWITLETDRICSGVVNPASLQDAHEQHRLVLELIPYMLSISYLDIDSLDVIFAMDFDYFGSHDEVITEALFGSTAFSSLLEMPGTKPIGCSPTMVIGLSDDCRTQARISIESKTSVYESRRQKNNSEEAISLSFIVRHYPEPGGKFDSVESFDRQSKLAEELMNEKIVPNFVKPLNDVIAHKRLT